MSSLLDCPVRHQQGQNQFLLTRRWLIKRSCKRVVRWWSPRSDSASWQSSCRYSAWNARQLARQITRQRHVRHWWAACCLALLVSLCFCWHFVLSHWARCKCLMSNRCLSGTTVNHYHVTVLHDQNSRCYSGSDGLVPIWARSRTHAAGHVPNSVVPRDAIVCVFAIAIKEHCSLLNSLSIRPSN